MCILILDVKKQQNSANDAVSFNNEEGKNETINDSSLKANFEMKICIANNIALLSVISFTHWRRMCACCIVWQDVTFTKQFNYMHG
jgi:Ni,Fe-hydrogenase maturation factor